MKAYKMDQSKAPLYEALENFRRKRIVPFDVPGHKRGRGNKELTEFLGERCVSVDINSMKPLDNLCHPTSVIRDAEQLAADAFGSSQAFFMVGGTTSSIQAMIFSVCRRGDKIIVPRNVHSCVINALIICGAEPVYIYPEKNESFGVSLAITREQVKQKILKNPDAKAIFINNPTYDGVCSDIKSIVKMAHDSGMLCLIDETYGTHFYFGDNMPLTAMEAGADMSSISMHKSGGSLTQSSLLLIGSNVNSNHVRKIINLTQTTSASYLLMTSLDVSRRNLALNGAEIFKNVLSMANYARTEINSIGGYLALGEEIIDGNTVYNFDSTKLNISTKNIGLTGFEIYDILREEYSIQIELGDTDHILAFISIGDRNEDLERLVCALTDIYRRFSKPIKKSICNQWIHSEILMTPQQAFYSNKVCLPLDKTEGMISCECVASYPSGVCLLVPGERISKSTIECIRYVSDKGCYLIGPEHSDSLYINVKTKIKEKKMNQAIIDIGSNSMHLTVYEIQETNFKILFRHKIMAGLAGYIDSNVLTQEGIDCACNGVLELKRIIDSLQIKNVRAFATASIRNVKNTEAILKKIKKECDMDVEILTEETEALYSYLGAMQELKFFKGSFIDVGGASTEIVLFSNGVPEQSISYKIGSLNLYKSCVKKILPGSNSIARIEKRINEEIKNYKKFTYPQRDEMICVGGTARSILKIAKIYFNLPKDCQTITAEQMKILYEEMIKCDKNFINLILRQVPERIHTLIPGFLIMRQILIRFKSKKIIISNYGVREGYLCREIIEIPEKNLNTHKTEN